MFVYVWHCYIILIVYVIFNFFFSEHKVNVSVLIDSLCNLCLLVVSKYFCKKILIEA